ncbi:unnamed protein product [Linum tenue]|uniref:Uncharacterized protein n=1 Tax=Linum tenue TaxID=586396 RepID=A0AAV0SAG1_9ROSI|nr:unnamed protein product [Linum tenue]
MQYYFLVWNGASGSEDLSTVTRLCEHTEDIGDVVSNILAEGWVQDFAILLKLAIEKVRDLVFNDSESGEKATVYESAVIEAVTEFGRAAEQVTTRRTNLICMMKMMELNDAESNQLVCETAKSPEDSRVTPLLFRAVKVDSTLMGHWDFLGFD